MTGLSRFTFGSVDYELGKRYTWADVERASVTSGVLRQVVDVVNAGLMSREDALCTVVMYLAEVQIRNMNEAVERLSLQLPAPLLMPREFPPQEPT